MVRSAVEECIGDEGRVLQSSIGFTCVRILTRRGARLSGMPLSRSKRCLERQRVAKASRRAATISSAME
jgi:hypothetical protein